MEAPVNTLHPSTHSANAFRVWGHVSWGAILAGVAIALTVQFVLSLLGTGIGMSTIDPLQSGGTPSAQAFSAGAALWWVVSFFLSLAIGGAVASHLAGFTTRLDGVLHGLATWAVATLLGIYLVSSGVGSVISGAVNATGSVFQGLATGVAATAPAVIEKGKESLSNSDISWDSIKYQVQAAITQKPVNGQPPAREDVMGSVKNLFNKGEAATVEDRQAVIAIMVRNSNLSPEDADKKLSELETNYQAATEVVRQKADKAKEEAKAAADITAKALSQLAILAFFSFLLSAIAAALGGVAGSDCRLRHAGAYKHVDPV